MAWRWIVSAVLATCAGIGPGVAEVTRIEITKVDSFAIGHQYGDVGAYERVIGIVRGDLDPIDPRNAGIVGIAQAPRNARERRSPLRACLRRPFRVAGVGRGRAVCRGGRSRQSKGRHRRRQS